MSLANPDPNDLGPLQDPTYANPAAVAAPPTGIFPAPAGVPVFPVWPPPSGGAPVTAWEMGPLVYPYPYGKTQGPNINTANPAPHSPWNSMYQPPKAGANQAQNVMPPKTYPAAMVNQPTKADRSMSAIPPSLPNTY